MAGDPPNLTWAQWVRHIAAGLGHDLTDDEVAYILFEQTDYPLTTIADTERQVRRFLNEVHK